MLNLIQNNHGSALVVALLMLIMLSFIGIASISTSVRDMDIAKNTTDRTDAFYVAEAGLEMAFGILKNNASVLANDSLMALMSPYTTMPNGSFNLAIQGTMLGTTPYKTITSMGTASEGQAAVQSQFKRKKNALNIWNNVMFAGSGQQGRGIQGNVAYHGPIHILGDGEDFTDQNGNGNWDDADQFTDSNGNGVWNPGEPLTLDTDGDGVWDPAEPYWDDNGNGMYDGTLTATDLAFDISGTAGQYNNYSGMPVTISSRIPALDQDYFNGEIVYTLEADMRVKHGTVNLSGNAKIGEPNQSGGSPAVKETVDGTYVNDGWGGNMGTANVYSDNGYSEAYDLGDELSFPSIHDSYTDPSTGTTYADYISWIQAHALVISGDVTLTNGTAYAGSSNSYGSISMDNKGNLNISGIVMFTGNVTFDGKKGNILYDGRGTIVSGGNMYINANVLSKGQFPTDDVMGFFSTHDLEIATGNGASQLDMMGAMFAQNKIVNAKQNNLAGAMVSNFFSVTNVPHMYFVPSIVDNLPPGMPGGGTIYKYTYKKVQGSWREL